MDIEKLMIIKDEADIKSAKITRLFEDTREIKKAIEDLKYLQRHAGEMIFTGNSGRIGDRDVMLKKVKINTLAGCVVVPALLLELADARLAELYKESDDIIKK